MECGLTYSRCPHSVTQVQIVSRWKTKLVITNEYAIKSRSPMLNGRRLGWDETLDDWLVSSDQEASSSLSSRLKIQEDRWPLKFGKKKYKIKTTKGQKTTKKRGARWWWIVLYTTVGCSILKIYPLDLTRLDWENTNFNVTSKDGIPQPQVSAFHTLFEQRRTLQQQR